MERLGKQRKRLELRDSFPARAPHFKDLSALSRLKRRSFLDYFSESLIFTDLLIRTMDAVEASAIKPTHADSRISRGKFPELDLFSFVEGFKGQEGHDMGNRLACRGKRHLNQGGSLLAC